MAGAHGQVLPPLWREALVGLDWIALQVSPIYYGFGAAPGDGRAVVLLPGFLATDLSLLPLHHWLSRIGYRPYLSGFSPNADCPDLLTERALATIDLAFEETGRKVCLVGHSLGGLIARSAATRRPQRVAQIVTLGTPLRLDGVHPFLLSLASSVRDTILERRREASIDPHCYTADCQCAFARSCAATGPSSVRRLSVYTKTDGVVSWPDCIDTGAVNVEVTGSHIGLPFNPQVFQQMSQALCALRHQTTSPAANGRRARGTRRSRSGYSRRFAARPIRSH